MNETYIWLALSVLFIVAIAWAMLNIWKGNVR